MARSARFRLPGAAAWLAVCLALGACGSIGPIRFSNPWAGSNAETPPAESDSDAEVYQRAQRERARYLEEEIARLRADLAQAEEAMVAIESGLRGVSTRADAVSALAEARIAVERARQRAPWRNDRLTEAEAKLDEAERQFAAGHVGAAVFFASRAARTATTLSEEARKVASQPDARFVQRTRVNLRTGPSTEAAVLAVLGEGTPVFPEREDGAWLLVRTAAGRVGWVHGSLVTAR